MSFYIGLPLLMVSAVLQSVWLERVSILGGRPDLVLLLVITWTVIRGLNDGMVWGIIGGICCDLLSGGPFGLWTVSLTLMTFVLGQPWVYTLGPTSIRLALIAGMGTLLAHTTFLVLMGFLGYTVDTGRAYTTLIVPAALLNFLLSPFSFRLLVLFHQQSLERGRA